MDDKDVFFGVLDEVFGPPVSRTESRMVVRAPNLQQVPKTLDDKSRGLFRRDDRWRLLQQTWEGGVLVHSEELPPPSGKPFTILKSRSVGLSTMDKQLMKAQLSALWRSLLASHDLLLSQEPTIAPLTGPRRRPLVIAVRNVIANWRK